MPSLPFKFTAAPSLGLPEADLNALADRIEIGDAGFTELLFVATSASRLVGPVPTQLKGSGFLASISSLWRPSLTSSNPEKARAQVANKIRELAAEVPSLPPDNVPIHQFNPALIPLIVQIIQMILELITKFRA